MGNSIQSKQVFIVLFALTISGCAGTSYLVSDRDGAKIELMVAPDHVLLECEYASENKEVPFGFMIHVLDDKKTVLTISQGNTVSKNDCDNRLKKIGRILTKTAKPIYIAAIGDIDEPRTAEATKYTYPGVGTFNGNGRALQFRAIANEEGLCFDAYSWDDKPCPGQDFPIRDNRKAK